MKHQLYNFAKYGVYRNVIHRGMHSHCIIHFPMQKSGSMYLRLLLANYIGLYYNNIEQPLDFLSINGWHPSEGVFPVMYWEQHKKKHPPITLLSKTPYTNFYRVKGMGQGLRYADKSTTKIITQTRNPLDTVVSKYHYTIKNRPVNADRYQSPSEAVDFVMDMYAKKYAAIKQLASQCNVMHITYEDLKMYPEVTLSILLRWLNIPIDVQAVKLALDYASFDRVQRFEIAQGKPVNQMEGATGHFARSGKIGQWKDYLSDSDVSRVVERLQEYGIGLEEFVLEDNNDGK